MTMKIKLVGGILLIIGTSIGAGMLALPIATAELGFIGSCILLVVVWLVMIYGAFLLLEVNLWLPDNSNLISMSKVTIGPIGQIISWLTYLLLLYSLLCAYIGGGSDLFHNLLFTMHMEIPKWLSSIVFTILVGSIVFIGIHAVDYANRGLMFIKFGAYLLLIILLMPFISLNKLSAGNLMHLTSASALMVTITSFGFSPIVPSLRVYFRNDIKKLKIAILVGSFIPLLGYIAWDAAIMGVIPLHGDQGLIAILHSQASTSNLVNTINAIASEGSVTFFVKLFTSICVVTSFLGVSLCLTDFLADGFQLEKKGMSNIFIHLVTFLPPLTIVLFFPNVFIKALEYAGIYCVILLLLLPAWMVWRGRYHKHITKEFKAPGGKLLLLALMVFSFVAIAEFLL